jgi:hypothetical protein
MLKILADRKGAMSFSFAIGFLTIMMLFSFLLAVTPAFVEKSKLDTFTNELLREAEIQGEVGAYTNAKIAELKADLGINPTRITFSRSGRVQLGEKITLTVEYDGSLGGGALPGITYTLQSRETGRSEVYWK